MTSTTHCGYCRGQLGGEGETSHTPRAAIGSIWFHYECLIRVCAIALRESEKGDPDTLPTATLTLH